MDFQKKPNGYWTRDRVEAEAKRFKTVKDWREGAASSYVTAVKNDWLDDICNYYGLERRVSLTEEVISKKIQGRSISLVPKSYVSVHAPAQWLCHDCGQVFSSRVNGVLYHDVGCKSCAIKKNSDALKTPLDTIVKKLKTKGIALEEPNRFVGVNHRTKFICLKDASHPSWEAVPYSLLNPSSNTGCPNCSHTVPITQETILKSIMGKSIGLVKFVAGAHRKSLFQCLKDPSHKNWAANNASIYRIGSGCPSCAKYGFDSNKPAYIYCIPIYSSTFGNVFGYGITNDWASRWLTHRRNLRKNGFTWGEPSFVLVADGSLIRNFETRIKKHLKLSGFSVNLGVEGFTTEAFKAEGLAFVEEQLSLLAKMVV